MHKLIKKVVILVQILYLKFFQKLRPEDDNWIHYIGGSEALPPPLETDEELFHIKVKERRKL